VVAAGC
jgi:hypothetical protein